MSQHRRFRSSRRPHRQQRQAARATRPPGAVIAKIQRPIMSNEADPPWLVYSENRLLNVMLPDSLVDDGLRELMGSHGKIYCYVRLVPDGVGQKLAIDGVAPAQDW